MYDCLCEAVCDVTTVPSHLKVSSDTIIGWGATLIFKLSKMKLFRASQTSVVHVEAVLTSNQSPVLPGKMFQTFINAVVCQALFVAVFYTSVDLLCKNSYKSSSLLGYFDCFQSNHTVGCCNINFRSLCQIKRKKNLLCKQCLYIFVVLFCATAVVSLPRLANFSPCDPLIFVSAPLFMLIAC